MDLEERAVALRGTGQAEDVSNRTRFTELAFQQSLWKHMVDAIISNLELDAHPEEIHAVVGLCTMTKLRNDFQVLDRDAEIHLSDPEYPADKKAEIHRNRMRIRLFNRYVEICAAFIGQKYAKLLLDGDVAGRLKLEKLISSVERRLGIKSSVPTKRPLLPWKFFVALAALESLAAGVVPSQKQVKEGALQTRAAFESGIGFGKQVARDSKIKELRRHEPANWKRIIRDLELVGLPRKAA